MNDTGAMRYFFPVVEQTYLAKPQWNVFAGIALPKEYADDFRGLYKVSNYRAFPIYLNLSLPHDLQAFRRYQKLYGDTSGRMNADEARYWLQPMPLYRLPSIRGVSKMQDIEETLTLYQDHTELTPAHALTLLGVAAMQEPHLAPDTALEAYCHVLDENPSSLITCHYLDAFLKPSYTLSGRIVYWEETLQRYPNNSLIMLHYALALDEAGRLDIALARYVEALEHEPENIELLKDYALLLDKDGDSWGAAKTYERILQWALANRKAAQYVFLFEKNHRGMLQDMTQ